MDLIALGMDHWFKNQANELCEPEQRIARVTVVHRGQYIIKNEFEDVPAKATRKFMYSIESKTDMPCVGDWVCVDYNDSENSANIHTIFAKKIVSASKICREEYEVADDRGKY